MHSSLRALASAACFAILAMHTSAAADAHTVEAAIDDGDARAVLMLLSESDTVQPGERFHVGVHFALDPGWHVYFRNPGEAAVGTEITFRPTQASIGALRFPTPTRLVDPSGTITTFGYEHEVLFVAAATIPEDAQGAVELEAIADFLVCRVECIPGRVTLRRSLPVEATSQPADAQTLRRFADTISALPRTPGDAGVHVGFSLATTAVRPGDTTRATFDVTCATCSARVQPNDAFFADRVPGLAVTPIAVRALDGGRVRVEVELRASPDDPGADQTLSGIVALPTPTGRVALEVTGAVPRARPGATPQQTSTPEERPEESSLFVILLLAFLGGIVLNAMPCVLPVLALKVFGIITRAGESRAARLRHVGAYTAGIVATFLALAGTVIALRAFGVGVGWGFQLQDPRFVGLLTAVLVVLALRLFGVYTVSVSGNALASGVDRTDGLARAFGEGVLSVVLATPCSAPFLGTAVGFALTRDAATITLVFVVVGVGLATPFVLLALVPGARRFLPKPGAWMHVLEQVLAFVLLGTATWLLWVVGQLSGVDGMARVLALSLLVACLTFFGARARALSSAWRAVVRSVALVLLVAGAGALIGDLSVARATPTSAAWSDDAVRAHLADDRVVFVDFTASWCITCKANERIVLASDPVRRAFADAGVITLVADYTERDARITQALARFDRAGVPLYLVYRPSRPGTPEVLPELLTNTIVLDAIARAEGEPR